MVLILRPIVLLYSGQQLLTPGASRIRGGDRQMSTFRIYDERLNQAPAQIEAGSWDEMLAWAAQNNLSVSKRRIVTDDERRSDMRRAYGIDGPIVSYAYCLQYGSERVHLVEFGSLEPAAPVIYRCAGFDAIGQSDEIASSEDAAAVFAQRLAVREHGSSATYMALARDPGPQDCRYVNFQVYIGRPDGNRDERKIKGQHITFSVDVERSAATYTVYDAEDSSWHRTGLSAADARELLAERNRENSKYGDRYYMVTDAEFLALQASATEG
jgi:hypothetical protein